MHIAVIEEMPVPTVTKRLSRSSRRRSSVLSALGLWCLYNRFQKITLIALVPATLKDLRLVHTSLLTCEETFQSDKNLLGIKYVVPPDEIDTFKRELRGYAAKIEIVSETEFVPEFQNVTSWPGSHKQQVIKLLSYRKLYSSHVLFLDADSICTIRRSNQKNAPSSFIINSWLYSPRVAICLQNTARWFGKVQYKRTSLVWNLPMKDRYVMGWTPQILSVKALKRAVHLLMKFQKVNNVQELIFASPNYQWTEYASYFLTLKAAGVWDHYHRSTVHTFDIDGSGKGLGIQVPGCLHVRANTEEDVQRLLLEVGQVPFIMLDDHKVNHTNVLTLVQRQLGFDVMNANDITKQSSGFAQLRF